MPHWMIICPLLLMQDQLEIDIMLIYLLDLGM